MKFLNSIINDDMIIHLKNDGLPCLNNKLTHHFLFTWNGLCKFENSNIISNNI